VTEVTIESIKDAALQYVSYGLPIIPICPADHKGMPHSHRQNCDCPGKSPVISGWQKHEHTTEKMVERWFDKNPYYNIGLPLGSVSGLIGVDIDGRGNMEKFEEFADGPIPDTWSYTTGNGYRLIYQLPPGIDTKKFALKLKDGEIAILCDGQQTVLPPSNHANGNNYAWILGKSPQEVPVATVPRWLLARITEGDEPFDEDMDLTENGVDDAGDNNQVTQDDWSGTITKGQRNDHLARLAGSLIARGTIPKEQVSLFLKAWNREHCEPPLPEPEIDKMVEGLALTEEMKRAKRGRDAATGKTIKKEFRPTPMANAFMRIEEREGKLWCYSSDDGSFYTCSVDEGPWRRVSEEGVKQNIRNFLIDPQRGGSEVWDTRRHVNEFLEALQAVLLHSEGDVTFDLGEQIERGNFELLDYIHVENGLVEWETGKLHPWDPKLRTTVQLDVSWEGLDAECPTWKSALEDWIPDEGTRKFLQEYVGLCLVPDTRYRTAVFIFGEGSNGKGLFLDTVTKLFGDAMTAIPLHRLTNRFETGNLRNKLINVCGDIDAQYLKETGTLKAIIGGDVLRGERKFGKSFDFRPVARLMFSANKLPQVADKTHAWYSRWKFIEFPNIFPVNPRFKRQFTEATEEELPGILAWAVRGLIRLESNNQFTTGSAMKKAADRYKETNDSVLYFLSECCNSVPHEGSATTLSQKALWRVYCDWCEQEGLQHVGMREFGRRAKGANYKKGRRSIRGTTKMCLLGIEMREAWFSTYDQYERLLASGG